MPNTTPPDAWRHRRRIIYATLIYCGLYLAWLGIVAEPSSLREQLALGLLGLAGTTIATYVAGAVIDDRNKRKGSAE